MNNARVESALHLRKPHITRGSRAIPPENVQRILPPGVGETLRLGPLSLGDVAITVDPQKAGGGFAFGTQALPPGGRSPRCRLLRQDEVLFVHKGQGRADVDGQTMAIVPGTVVYVPRQSWCSLRNTGTGILQLVWVVAPPGIELFFRELASLTSGIVNPADVQQIAQRHGIELSLEPERAQPPPPRRRRRRRRGRDQGTRGQAVAGRPASSPPPVAQPPPPPSAPPVSSGGGQGPSPGSVRPSRRRRHGVSRRSGATPIPRGVQAAPPSRRVTRRRRSHVREVYMEGRWVQVTGEGPVISSGGNA